VISYPAKERHRPLTPFGAKLSATGPSLMMQGRFIEKCQCWRIRWSQQCCPSRRTYRWPPRGVCRRRLIEVRDHNQCNCPVPNYTVWWTEARVCEQLAQGCYLAVHRAGIKPGTSQSPVWHATAIAPSHKPTILQRNTWKPTGHVSK